MNKQQNDQKQRKPDQQGQGDQQPAQQQQAANRDQSSRGGNPGSEKSAAQGFDRNQQQRKPNDNTIPEIDPDDQTDSPQMNEGSEGESAPSVRRGALNTQYGTDSTRSRGETPQNNVKGSTDEAPDMQGEQSTGGDRDTLKTGRK